MAKSGRTKRFTEHEIEGTLEYYKTVWGLDLTREKVLERMRYEYERGEEQRERDAIEERQDILANRIF